MELPLFIPSILISYIGFSVVTLTETALFALQRSQFESLSKQKPHFEKKVDVWMQRPLTFCASLVFWKICLKGFFLFFSLFGLLARSSFTHYLLFSLAMAFFLLTTEFLLKLAAMKHPSVLLRILYPLVSPLFSLYSFLFARRSLTEMLLRGKKIPPITYRAFFEPDAEQEASETPSMEREFVENVFDFASTQVSEVMTRKEKTFALRSDKTIAESLPLIEEEGYTRLPLLDAAGEKVTGILNIQELVNQITTQSQWEKIQMGDIAIPATTFSHRETLDRAFREFRRKRTQMALVTDESGEWIGIVTVSDILSYLFGERGGEAQ